MPLVFTVKPVVHITVKAKRDYRRFGQKRQRAKREVTELEMVSRLFRGKRNAARQSLKGEPLSFKRHDVILHRLHGPERALDFLAREEFHPFEPVRVEDRGVEGTRDDDARRRGANFRRHGGSLRCPPLATS